MSKWPIQWAPSFSYHFGEIHDSKGEQGLTGQFTRDWGEEENVASHSSIYCDSLLTNKRHSNWLPSPFWSVLWKKNENEREIWKRIRQSPFKDWKESTSWHPQIQLALAKEPNLNWNDWQRDYFPMRKIKIVSTHTGENQKVNCTYQYSMIMNCWCLCIRIRRVVGHSKW